MTTKEQAAQFLDEFWNSYMKMMKEDVERDLLFGKKTIVSTDVDDFFRPWEEKLETMLRDAEARYEDSRKLNQKLESNFLAERYKVSELEKELTAFRLAAKAKEATP